MEDLVKAGLLVVGLIVLVILGESYSFAKDHGLETAIVFKTAISAAGLVIASVLIGLKLGAAWGFCIGINLVWRCLWPLLDALAAVNAVGPSLNPDVLDLPWYGQWWFQWGVQGILVGLSVYLLSRKRKNSRF